MNAVELFSELSRLGVRLWAEGEQLRVRAPKGVLTPDLTSELSRRKEEILDFLRQVHASTVAATAPPLVPVPRLGEAAELPLSYSQERLWFIDRWEPGSAAYNISDGLRLEGDLDTAALGRSLQEIARRHEALRTTFESRGGRPVQRIAPDLAFAPRQVDLANLPEGARYRAFAEEAAAEVRRPFDLARGPLARAALFRLGAREHALLLTFHHIVYDGWSAGVVIRELAALYGAYTRGLPSPLPELPVQYADYASWQRRWLQGEVLEKELESWKRRLDGAPPSLDVPADHPRPAVRTTRGAARRLALPADASATVRRLAQAAGATPFLVLLAAWQALLLRLTGERDLVVGTPVANRNRPEIEGLIGFFVNTLALRTDLAGDPPFQELVGRARETWLSAQAHQELPFERLVEALHPERDLSRTPVFQVLFVLQNAPAQEMEAPGLRLRRLELPESTAKFDLTLELVEGERYEGALEYSADLFEAPTAERLARHFTTLLTGALAAPDTRLSDLPLLSEPERHQLRLGWNDTAADLASSDSSLWGLIAAQAARTPDAPAVTFEGETLSYSGLAARAAALAARLRALGAGPETRVGICAERSLELVAGLAGILAAGAAYVPLDPSYPRERLAFMLEDSAVPVLLTQERLRATLPDYPGTVLDLDFDGEEGGPVGPAPDGPAGGLHAAYAIYTSGSTGRPKGAVNSHRAIVNRLLWMQQAYGLTAADVVLQKTPFSFDVSVWEFFWPLLTGARLAVARPGGHQDPAYLARLIVEEGVTTLHFVPSMLQVFLEAPGLEACRSLRRVICSGEALPAELARRFHERLPWAALHNLYGPTEAAVDVSAWPCEPGSAERAVPIGRPIANVRLHVLDPDFHPVPAGVPGELHIGGVALARGYLGRPGLTAERFVPDPVSGEAGERLYRTGDLARHRADGAIEYLGRLDHQVKIRGVRIELGEVEAALGGHPALREAAVLARPVRSGGGLELVAFVVPAEAPAPGVSELRRFLSGVLPDALVPTAFVTLEAMPLTPSGKVDRKALSRLELGARSTGEAAGAAEPRTAVEEVLAGIWSEVLGLPRVGVHDDFFDLGGHSLLATQLMSRVGESFQVDLPLRALFEARTVARLGERIAAAQEAGQGLAVPPLERASRDRPLPLSYSQESIWLFEQLAPGTPAYTTCRSGRIRGALDLPALGATLDELIHRHEVLRTGYRLLDGHPVQEVYPATPYPLPRIDLAGLPGEAREAEALRISQEEAETPVDLTRVPVLRARLLRLGPEEHVFVLSIHHIAYDLWSGGLLLGEIERLYLDFAAGRQPDLPEPPFQYADFAVWQRRWLQGEVLERQLAYWKERLAGVPPLALPADRPRPAREPHRGGAAYGRLSRELTAGLEVLGRREGATPYMVLLAVFKAVLVRSTGQDDLAVGSFITNRTRVELERVLGFFDNTVVLRTDLGADPSFRALLGRVRDTALGAYAHQHLPFDRLVEELQPERRSLTPLFQAAFILMLNYPAMERELAGLKVVPYNLVPRAAKFDLLSAFRDAPDGGLVAILEYSADLFDDATMERLLGHLRRLAEAAVAEPDARLADLPMLTEGERRQLLDWNPGTAAPAEWTLHQRFAVWAERTPDAPAVTCEGESLTYRELRGHARRLARHLAAAGLAPGSLVGLLAERSLELVAGILAILEAGAAYLPLDPVQPDDRLAFLLADSGTDVVLCSGSLRERVAGRRVIVLEEALASTPPDLDLPRVDPSWPVYVIYTSGSTGRPKGVVVTHACVARLFAATDPWLGFGPEDVWTLFHSFAFDFSVWELWGALLYGGRLVVVPYLVSRSPEDFLALLAREGVTVLNQTPSAFRQLVHAEGEAGEAVEKDLALRYVMFGGEALELESLRPWFERHGDARPRLINLYGITETTVHVTYRPLSLVDLGRSGSPVGVPIPDRTVHLLDRHGALVPLGAAGEICVGGAGLALGYLRRPELTAARFVPDPFGPAGSRLYRSGDLARRRADGEIEYLGRIDLQVKIRGFRIELGEIEAVLASHPQIREAAVLARPDPSGEVSLVAYVVPASPADRRAFLAGRLPAYMIPAAFVDLPALPLTANGKVDRRALPAPDRTSEPGGAYAPPRNPAEELLAAIWAEVLGRPRVGIHDDFFGLGGHSLLATRLVSRVRAAFGAELPLRTVFEAPTVARLARELGEAAGPVLPPIVPVEEPGDRPLSWAQQRLWFLDRLEPGSATYNVPVAFRLSGDLDEPAFAASLEEIRARHEALRTTFHPVQDGDPVQRVAPHVPRPLPLVDLAALPDPEAEARRLAAEEAGRPFDLESGPVARGVLLRLAPREHVALLDVHHIVFDEGSAAVLTAELAALYPAFLEGRPSPLPPLPVQYGDYAVWQRRFLAGEIFERQLAYWRESLSGAPTLLELPADHPRPVSPTGKGGERFAAIPAATAARVEALARAGAATPFMALLAVWAAQLGRLTGQPEVVIGTPVANRDRAEIEGLIGFFVNTLALRIDLSGEPGLAAALERVRETTLAAFAHQHLPFERLVEELQPERSLTHTPLFQVMFVLQDAAAENLALPGLALGPFAIPAATAKFDLTLFLTRTADGLRARAEYAADLFDAPTVDRFLAGFVTLLEGAVAEPDRPLAGLPLLPEAERHQVLVEWNEPPVAASTRPVHLWFEEQAARDPGRIAVIDGSEALTYGEVNRRADALADHLIRLGVGPDVRVGVFLARGWAMGVAMLAVFKAGGCYLPLDPGYPAERLVYMLESSGAPIVVTQAALADSLPPFEGAVLRMEDEVLAAAEESGGEERPRRPDIDGESLSYIVYTSGSTGKPKGVVVPHRVLSNLIAWQLEDFDHPQARTLQFASPSFDASPHEVFATWSAGGTLVVATAEHRRDPEALLAWIRANRVERLFLPFVALQQIAEVWLRSGEPAPSSLIEIQTSGEQLRSSPEVAALFQALPGCILHNQYGPSETHVVTAYRLPRDPAAWAPLPPIGRPIAATAVYILDRGLRPVPIGVPGEAWLGGVMVARGYLERPDLTAERFLPDPYGAPGSRFYKSGDVARFLPSGEIDFLGRIDHQVKIRGYRVEPGEIEVVLSTHPAVREVAVVLRGEAANRSLAACVIPMDPGQGPELVATLRAFLRERLPDFMVPALFLPMESFPHTPTGKVDRLTLSRLASKRQSRGAETVPARRPGRIPAGSTLEIERLLAGIWGEVLGRDAEAIGPDDDFFDLGGHSLLATRVLSRIRNAFGVEARLRLLFEAQTLGALAERIAALRATAPPAEALPIARADRSRPLPLSFAQERLWFFDQLEPDSPVYNVPSAFSLRGPFSLAAFDAAVQALVRRQESLRTRFAVAGDRPLQEVLPELAIAIPLVDLSALEPAVRDPLVGSLLDEEAQRPFDLARGPLFRILAVRRAAEEHAFVVTLHHIVSDGWSAGVLIAELAALYEAALTGRPARLPELPVQYADFAVWQRSWLTREALAGQAAYWRQALAGAPLVLELPTDHPRGAAESHRGGTVDLHVPPRVAAAVAQLGRETGTTLFMTLLAAYAALLSRWTGQTDLLVGSPIAGRNRQEIEGLIGFFVNTLVLRAELGGDPDFRTLLQRVAERTFAAYAHQDLPFERLVEEVAPERDLSRSPVFQVMLVLLNVPKVELAAAGAVIEPLPVTDETAKFDLLVAVEEDRSGGLSGSAVYARDLFERPTVERFLDHFTRLLEAAVADPSTRLSELPLLGPAERAQVLWEWNDTRRDDPAGRTVPELFREQVRERPDAPALVSGEETWTYLQLDAVSDHLARGLARLGVGPEVRVGVGLRRSPDLIAALLAVLKAGGAYLPLDPESPVERLAGMLEDAAAPLALVEPELLASLPRVDDQRLLTLADLDAAPEGPFPPVPVTPDHLAYVMYTSGSTGRPKGVAVTHRGIARLVRGGGFADLGPGEVFLQLAPVAFDASTLEIWGPLLNGGCLALPPPGHLSLAEIDAEIRRAAVTTLWLTTGLFHQMVDARADGLDAIGGVRQLLTGGDVLSVPHARTAVERLAPGAILVNAYGPTENTTFTTCHRLDAHSRIDGALPIGRPIGNTHTLILDAGLRPVPIGVEGDLYAGGDGLARGYLGRPGLTAERFLPAPFGAPGERIYQTGDRARWRADGTLDFRGRRDFQVKLRGFRVELGEIEAVLDAHPRVRQAAVLVARRSTGDKVLVACVAVGGAGGDAPGAGLAEELRQLARERLPEQMVPSAFLLREELPLTPNGKVDRAALTREVESAGIPNLGTRSGEGEDDGAAPRGPVEEMLAGIWAQVLEIDRVGRHDNFFDLSGHSLLATQVAHRIREAFGVEIPLRRLFERATLAELAMDIDAQMSGAAAAAARTAPIEPIPHGGFLRASSFQRLIWDAQGGAFSAMYNIPFVMGLRGGLDLGVLRATLAEILRRHESLRTGFEEHDGVLYQRIAPVCEPALALVDLGGLPEPLRAPAADELIAFEEHHPFDISRPPLFRCWLLRVAPEHHIAVFDMYHITSDGWSMEIFKMELGALYQAFAQGRPSPLPEPTVQYADFIVWQRRWFEGPGFEENLEYWRRRLADRPPVLELPCPRPRPAAVGPTGRRCPAPFDLEPSRRLRALARETGCTLPMVLFAAYAALLGRYSGRTDLLLGSTFSARDRNEIAGMIGLFMNVIPLRIDLSNASFRELVRRARVEMLASFRHQVPLSELGRLLPPGEKLTRTSFYKLMFNMLSFQRSQPVAAVVEQGDGIAVGGLSLELLTDVKPDAKYEMVQECWEEGEMVLVNFTVPADLLDEDELERLRDDYLEVVGQALADPEIPVDRLLPSPRFLPVPVIRT